MDQPVLDAVAEPAHSANLPHVHTGLKGASESVAMEAIDKKVATREPARRAGPPIIDPTDRDALRRAILHYEILGAPIASRDPMDHPHTF
jgi:hypothetical protein